jgi:hypothetical protein
MLTVPIHLVSTSVKKKSGIIIFGINTVTLRSDFLTGPALVDIRAFIILKTLLTKYFSQLAINKNGMMIRRFVTFSSC